MPAQELSVEKLYQACDTEQLDFETTSDLEQLQDPVGQPRAAEALRFGTRIDHSGYNIYALGPPGTDRFTVVREHLKRQAVQEERPADWCYVYNFDEPHKPSVLKLPAGRGRELAEGMEQLVEEVRNALKAAFESEEYQNRAQSIQEEFREKQQNALEELQEEAKKRDLTAHRTPQGLVFAPVRNGETLSPQEFHELPEDERKKIENDVEELQKLSQRMFQSTPSWERETRDKLRELNRQVTKYAVKPLIDELRTKYEQVDQVGTYLDAVEKDLVEHARELVAPEGDQRQQQQQQLQRLLQGGGDGGSSGNGQPGQAAGDGLRRYRVNLIVDNSDTEGAPVVHEDNPTYQNLLGRVEHMAQMGALITDFNMIKAGALHRANGGYLILDARKVLQQPYAWEGLKRALRSRQIKIESLAQMFSLISTVSLEPEPAELETKVTLIGEPLIYYLLQHYDPEFAELFKVAAEFGVDMDRGNGNQDLYARLIGTLVQREQLRPFEKGAVARVIEESARKAGDAEKLSTRTQDLTDLLREADYWASQNGDDHVSAGAVQQAIDQWIYRSDQMRERIYEAIQRNTIRVETEGRRSGQANGLSVLMLGGFAFGRPSRITCRVRMGRGEVVDIEREVEMGGPIHSKGVLILSGFLGGRYALEKPLALSASLVFEQSYGGIEGDSASSAELYALLSAIADIPVRQDLAITGSVDQHGQVQAIGGVNEKIEGFFDVCRQRGLTGGQGVLIPASNVRHLMLRKDVRDAVDQGQFHVYSVENIDQGIELLTGIEAGEPDQSGQYPEDTVNGRVQRCLADMAQKRTAYVSEPDSGKGKSSA